ncbi:hypothetical protein R1flu_023366 [Riccia fluitans]|uniref:EthD domain-containing protein n=1 Tax=Riccia fluitans TaxID=41844 RepID=A0ABD1XRU5_9MARC
MSPKRSQLVKLVVMVKRKKGMSFEEFDKYWTEKHGPLLCSLPIFKEKTIKYNQMHLDVSKMREYGTENGFPIFKDFDGMLEVYARSYQDFEAVFASDDYKNIIIPDEEKFTDREGIRMFFVQDEVHFDINDPSDSSTPA